jgi:hypothetical protein
MTCNMLRSKCALSYLQNSVTLVVEIFSNHIITKRIFIAKVQKQIPIKVEGLKRFKNFILSLLVFFLLEINKTAKNDTEVTSHNLPTISSTLWRRISSSKPL